MRIIFVLWCLAVAFFLFQPHTDFEERWERCSGLAQAADRGLQGDREGQMVEDCMDIAPPVE